jgi:hypothetical protein
VIKLSSGVNSCFVVQALSSFSILLSFRYANHRTGVIVHSRFSFCFRFDVPVHALWTQSSEIQQRSYEYIIDVAILKIKIATPIFFQNQHVEKIFGMSSGMSLHKP